MINFKEKIMGNKNKTISIILGLMLFLLALACGDTAKDKKDKENANLTNLVVLSTLSRSAASSTPAPLSYSGIPAKNGYRTFSSVSLTAVTSGFTAVSYSVSPSLPTGLSLNTSTGAITGVTPSTTQSATNYTVTATSSTGSTVTATLTIEIVSSSFFCNTSGIATGCDSSKPFSCSSSNLCYASYAGCTGSSSCGY